MVELVNGCSNKYRSTSLQFAIYKQLLYSAVYIGSACVHVYNVYIHVLYVYWCDQGFVVRIVIQ